MLFHILVGKLTFSKFRVNNHIDAISLIGRKSVKFRVNTSYSCYFTYWSEKCKI